MSFAPSCCKWLVPVSLVLGFASGCTKSSEQPVEQKQPAQESSKGDDYNNRASQTPTDTTEQSSPSSTIESGSSVPVVIDEKALKQSYAFDTANMSYKFEYLNTKKDGTLKFENGKARLEFQNLQDGTKGDLSLSLYEGTELKLKGEIKDVILSKGPNNLKLTLKPVGSNSSTTDLQVNVELDAQPIPSGGGSTGGTTNPGSNGNGNTGNTGNTNTGNTNPGNGSGNNNNGNQPNSGGGVPPTGGNTDPSKLAFEKDIKPIFTAHCAECHHSGGQSPDLSSKASASKSIDRVIARIGQTSSPMPPKPRDSVPSADQDKIKKWKSEGMSQ